MYTIIKKNQTHNIVYIILASCRTSQDNNYNLKNIEHNASASSDSGEPHWAHIFKDTNSIISPRGDFLMLCTCRMVDKAKEIMIKLREIFCKQNKLCSVSI